MKKISELPSANPKKLKKIAKAIAKEEAEESKASLAERVSVFGEKFLVSTPDDWSKYDGVGWVHATELDQFTCNYSYCYGTSKWYKNSEMLLTTDGNKIHKSLAEKGDWVKCPEAGKYYRKALGQVVYSGEGEKQLIVSPEAKNGSYRKCSYSNRFYPSAYLRKISFSDTYDWIHRKYLDEPGGGSFKSCPVCERNYEGSMVKHYTQHNPAVHIGGYTTFCTICHKKHAFQGLIHPHDYSNYPAPIHTKKTRLGSIIKDGMVFATNQPMEIKDYRLFGVEVETELAMNLAKRKGATRHTLAFAVRKALGDDFVITKEDGTLTMNGKYSNGEPGATYAGFEVVTAPADLAAHRERWPKLEQAEGYKFLRAWDTDTCGFHVHVSKASLTTLQIGKMLVFINHPNNKKLVQKIAGRSEKKFTRYVPKEPSDILHPDKVCNPDETKPRDRARRVALNISNDKTVEFRIFRGTIHPRHILRNIEFCDAVCDFCYPGSRSLRDYGNPQAFIDYVDSNRKRWPLLAEWFAHWKMINVKELGPKANRDLVTLKPSESVEPEDKTDEALGVAMYSEIPPSPGWLNDPPKFKYDGFVVINQKKKTPSFADELEPAVIASADDDDDESSDEDTEN